MHVAFILVCARRVFTTRLPAAVVELTNRGEKRAYRERDDILGDGKVR